MLKCLVLNASVTVVLLLLDNKASGSLLIWPHLLRKPLITEEIFNGKLYFLRNYLPLITTVIVVEKVQKLVG